MGMKIGTLINERIHMKQNGLTHLINNFDK